MKKYILTESQIRNLVSGFVDEAKGDTKYTPEYLEKIKKKYKGRPISDFIKGEDSGVYQRVAFLGKDFFNDFTKDMIRITDDRWTLDEVKKYISNFKTTEEFKKDKNYKSIYYYIWTRHRGMWPELTSNLKKSFGVHTKRDGDVITQKIIDKLKDTNPEWDFTNVSYYFDTKGERFVNGMVCHKKDIDGNEHGISNDVLYQDINRFGRACWKCRRQQAKPRRYTNDELADEAKKYNKKYDFLKGSPGFYDTARKRGKDFLEKITLHMTPSGESSDKLIYVHEFYDSDEKPYAAYVGLTNDSKRRYKEHVTGLYNDKKTITTQVAKFLKDNPNYTHEYKELTDYVDFKTAVRLENEWEKKYNEDGWIMLNVVKTGSLGSPYKVYNKEIRDKIKDCIENGMTLKEFMEKYSNLYSAIINRKLNRHPHNYLDGLKRIRNKPTE
jgi:predicted GIY-YIG superfamily endonuclease